MDVAKKSIELGVGFVGGIIIFGSIGMALFSNVSTAGWNSTVATIWPYTAVFAMLGLIISLIYSVTKH